MVVSYGAALNEQREKIIAQKLPYVLVNAMFLKPIDKAFLAKWVDEVKEVEVIEDLEGENGLKEKVALFLSELSAHRPKEP